MGHLSITMDANIENGGAYSCEEALEEINVTYLPAQDGQLRLINFAVNVVCKMAHCFVRLRLGIPEVGPCRFFRRVRNR